MIGPKKPATKPMPPASAAPLNENTSDLVQPFASDVDGVI